MSPKTFPALHDMDGGGILPDVATDKRRRKRRGRPPLPAGERRATLCVRLPADLLGDFRAALRRRGERAGRALEALVRRYVARHGGR